MFLPLIPDPGLDAFGKGEGGRRVCLGEYLKDCVADCFGGD